MAPVLMAGMTIFALGNVRLAGYVMAAGVGLGAVLRLVLRTSRSGGLAVRSRVIDVVLMTGLALALAVITYSLDLTPRT